MKVRYTKDYTDEYGQFFPAGCVAEHPETEGMKRIVAGVCKETDPDAYSRRQPLSAPLPVECATNLQGIYAGAALDIAMSEPANEGTITDRPPKKK
jgi:hypothetical protein